MVSKTLVSLLAVLMTVILLVLTYYFSTIFNQSDDSTEHSNTTMPKKSESSYLYVFGGILKRDPSNQEPWSHITNYTSRLKIATGEWKSIKELSTKRTYFCGAVVGKKIYLFGGNQFLPYKTDKLPSNDVYDCLTDTYSPLPLMPDLQLTDCGAAVLNDFIYVSADSIPLNESNTNMDNWFRFDTRTNQWSRLSPMKEERTGHEVIELNGLLYAVGGYGDDNMKVYNTTTDKWSNSLAKPSYGGGFFLADAATAHEGKIYSIGPNGFEVYSPDTDQWTTLTRPDPYLLEARAYHDRKLVSMNGKVWAVGGNSALARQGVDSIYQPIMNLHSYDLFTDKWTTEQEIDVGRIRGHSVFVVNL